LQIVLNNSARNRSLEPEQSIQVDRLEDAAEWFSWRCRLFVKSR